MMTANDRLQLAINFLNANLDTDREGDLLNARDDLIDFIYLPKADSIDVEAGRVSIDWPTHVPGKKPFDPAKDELKAIQHDGRQLFGQLIRMQDDHRQADKDGSWPSRKLHRQEITASWLLVPAGPREDRRTFALASVPSLRDGFLTLLLHLALTHSTGDIRACPVCGKLFVRTGRREYDSTRCASIASSRANRAKRKREAEERKRQARTARKK